MDPFDKKNCRPVGVLPLLLKVHERVICEQAPIFFNEILCRFRKAHSTQHASFELITLWQTSLRRGGFVGSILMDLSKTYQLLYPIGFIDITKSKANRSR